MNEYIQENKVLKKLVSHQEKYVINLQTEIYNLKQVIAENKIKGKYKSINSGLLISQVDELKGKILCIEQEDVLLKQKKHNVKSINSIGFLQKIRKNIEWKRILFHIRQKKYLMKTIILKLTKM